MVALFTPIPNGKVLAAVCAVNGLRGRVLETAAGAFAVLDDTSAGATDKAGEVISGFVKDRPILAHIVPHNIGSQRVVEHCGFVRVGEAVADDGLSELIYRLD